MTTPLRRLPHQSVDGCRLLSEGGAEYADGAEEHVFRVLSEAADLCSTSDELASQARDWPETYHLATERANLLRPLDWALDSRVLEIGAGCGAITRYLGERCGVVDALEPMRSRARSARARTRDLEGVEIFVGSVDDVPPEPAYDAAVIVGVFEYVGAGRTEREPYAAFLRTVARLLKPGGTLVLAIENKLGVKYLCGAPEDHTGLAYESLEGYNAGSPARTFSRSELESLATEAGLRPRVLGLFPDYKLTRTVYGDELLSTHPALARQIPTFPSPDWAKGPSRVASEARVWSTLLDAGLGGETPNSFLLLAMQEGGTGRDLWPADVLATYYSTGRRAELTVETCLRRDGDALVFDRHRLVPGRTGESLLRVSSSPFVEGEDLVQRMAAAPDDETLHRLLGQWLMALDRALAEGSLPLIDLVPHNAVIDADGNVTIVDAKWDLPDVDRSLIVGRAALVTAPRLARLTAPSRWSVGTLEGLVLHLGSLLGLSPLGKWLPQVLQREAELQVLVSNVPIEVTAEGTAVDRMRAILEADLATTLVALSMMTSVPAYQRGRIEHELTRVSSLLGSVQHEASAQRDRAEHAEQLAQSLQDRAEHAEQLAQSLQDRAEHAEQLAQAAHTELASLRATMVVRYSAPLRLLYQRLLDRV